MNILAGIPAAIDVEWMDGTDRHYKGYQWEVQDGLLWLTDDSRPAVCIPLASVRYWTAGPA